MLSRRKFLTSTALTATGILLAGSPALASVNVVAGAIRWDAWNAGADGSVGSAVRAALGPSKYQNRAPWFAQPISPYAIAIDGNQQSIMDQEITYAKNAGLNYWAYCWYGDTDPSMQKAWVLHQSSAIKNQVNWCMILQFSRMGNASAFNALIPTYVSYFQQTNHQKVLGGRALLYIFIDSTTSLAANWGNSWANVQASLNALRTACTSAGLATPYIVIMNGDPAAGASIRSQTSADAISNYTSQLAAGQPATYAAQDTTAQAYWAALAATGAPIIPICQTGWDTRPRKQTPQPWAPNPPLAGMLNYVAAGTPAQIAAHIQAAVSYIGANAAACPSKTLLIYSWNENDEGGSSLVPTYTPTGPNTAILDAVAAILSNS